VEDEVIDDVEEAASEVGENGTEASGDTHHPAPISVDASPQTDSPAVQFGTRKRSITVFCCVGLSVL